QPRSITDMNTAENQAFKDRYPLARFPIKEPVAEGVIYTYLATDKFPGPYPWVDKDGSFFLSAHTFSWEGLTEVNGHLVEGRAVRSSMILCGEITGGHVK